MMVQATKHLSTDIAAIEERIEKGAQWLSEHDEAHPRYGGNRKLYLELVGQYMALIVEREEQTGHWQMCVMTLPPGVTWGKGGHRTVRVLWKGKPKDDDEMSLDQLKDLIETVDMVKEARA